jgi:hypothetical protein
LSAAYSRSHRRAGIGGACRRTITQARLRRSASRALNSARPTVTVRPSGRGTEPPAASTATTKSRSAIRYASTSESILHMPSTSALDAANVKETTRSQSRKPVLNRINSSQGRPGRVDARTRASVLPQWRSQNELGAAAASLPGPLRFHRPGPRIGPPRGTGLKSPLSGIWCRRCQPLVITFQLAARCSAVRQANACAVRVGL